MDKTETPLRLAQEVLIVKFAQGIISGNVTNVKCSRVQSVGEQVCKFFKNLGVALKL